MDDADGAAEAAELLADPDDASVATDEAELAAELEGTEDGLTADETGIEAVDDAGADAADDEGTDAADDASVAEGSETEAARTAVAVGTEHAVRFWWCMRRL